MTVVKNWIHELKSKQGNTQWFKQNVDVLYADIQQKLAQHNQIMWGNRRDKLQVELVQSVILVLPFLSSIHKIEPWRVLLIELRDFSIHVCDEPLKLKLLIGICRFFITTNDISNAKIAIDFAHDVIKENNITPYPIDFIIMDLWVQVYTQCTVNYHDLHHVLAYQPHLRTAELGAHLHQVLSAYCNKCSQYESALTFGHLAYDYWEKQLPNPVAIEPLAYSAYMMAICYRQQRNFVSADHLLVQAGKYFAMCDNVWQYSRVAFENASILFERGEYDRALTWYKICAEEFGEMEDNVRKQRSLHGLAISSSMFIETLPLAREYLDEAILLASIDDNPYDIAHLYHSRAFLTAREEATNLKPRLDYFSETKNEIAFGLNLCDQVKDDQMREYLIGLYVELKTMIDNNDERLSMPNVVSPSFDADMPDFPDMPQN